MKKLAALIGALACLRIMEMPRREPMPRVINNYYITKTGCGGNCKCGKH